MDDFDPVTYSDVNEAWGSLMLPPVTAAEAHVIARKLVRKFGGKAMRMPWFMRRINRSWARRESTFDRHDIRNGLPRMVHDVSHYVHAELHPHAKTHCAPHAALERAMVEHVIAKGWHQAKVRRPKRTTAERRQADLARTLGLIKGWETKVKRANTRLITLRKKARRLQKLCVSGNNDMAPLAVPGTMSYISDVTGEAPRT